MKLNAPVISRLALLIVCAVALSGCHFTIQRETEIILTENVTVSGANRINNTNGTLTENDLYEEVLLQGWKNGLVTFPLGTNCDFTKNILELAEKVKDPVQFLDSPFAPLLKIFFVQGKLDGLVLTKIALEPSSGNFDTITRCSLRAFDETQGTINSYSAAGPFQGKPVLTPDRNIDIYRVIRDAGVECLTSEMTMQGSRPQNDLIFTAKATAVYEVKLRFFSF
ncbi:MAG TPA: hypothetical protein PLY90_12770 [Candidatus Hydrogenedentes bacterium]|jgi:hypothetical protein|nr:MAG: hypothetical protein BWY07_02239 [Candidatus Hydrogenedentes bacterium ADurb.Bin170]HNZ48034.1 hypothetical protein [Candidatus Hydrogenedentota bacterium]HQB04150.1 hypothetical protein [Candidatus Hydrogenedentota bacterium]